MNRALDEALALHKLGRLKDAERLCRDLLKRSPDLADGWFFLGAVQNQQDRATKAVSSLKRAIHLQPNHAQAQNHLGLALTSLHEYEEAIVAFRKAISIEPQFFEAYNNLGRALHEAGDLDSAIASFSRCIDIAPDCVDAYFNSGLSYYALARFPEAVTAFQKVVKLNSSDVDGLNNLGVALAALRRHDEAIVAYRRLLSIAPDFADGYHNLANTLSAQRRYEEALTNYRAAIRINPKYISAKKNLAITLLELRRYTEAIAAAKEVLELEPDDRKMLGYIAFAQTAMCDWVSAHSTTDLLRQYVSDDGFVDPFIAVALGLSAETQRLCSSKTVNGIAGPFLPALVMKDEQTEKLRIAYVSPDFRDHPVGNAIVRLLELHDRTQYEIIGVTLTSNDGSAIRQRIEQGVDQFIDITAQSDAEAAQTLRTAGVQIAVDLGGHTWQARPGIFKNRVAPIQVNYFGYASTVGGDFMDYVLADRTVLPIDQQKYFSERIAYIESGYMTYDDARVVSNQFTSRHQVELPEGQFVFCCFNQSYKFSGPVFDVWMRLLASVKDSVLWISAQPTAISSTLKQEAAARGVDPARIIFAKRVDKIEDHLARLSFADLFLDTLPYNAHMTAADAIWAGLPIVTCKGDTFAGRVAASILNVSKLPELITRDLKEYEALAIALATDPVLLRGYRERLSLAKAQGNLFNADTHRRYVEAAFAIMWSSFRAGKLKQSFTAIPSSP